MLVDRLGGSEPKPPRFFAFGQSERGGFLIRKGVSGAISGAHPVVDNNVFDGNFGGIVLSQTTDYEDVFGYYDFNTIVNSTDKGFYLYDMYGSQTIAVRNCIIVGNGMGIGAWGVSQIVFSSEYNDVWNNPGGDYYSYWSTMGPGAGDISVDPQFSNAGSGDFTLLPGSLALTAGSEGGQIGAHGRAPALVAPVFCDGFETGTANAWTAATP